MQRSSAVGLRYVNLGAAPTVVLSFLGLFSPFPAIISVAASVFYHIKLVPLPFTKWVVFHRNAECPKDKIHKTQISHNAISSLQSSNGLGFLLAFCHSLVLQAVFFYNFSWVLNFYLRGVNRRYFILALLELECAHSLLISIIFSMSLCFSSATIPPSCIQEIWCLKNIFLWGYPGALVS